MSTAGTFESARPLPRGLGVRRPRYGEMVVKAVLGACALLSVATTVGIVFALLQPTIEFFADVSIVEFLTSTTWSPLFADPQFGVVPLVSATFLITGIALALSVPVGLLSAIYLSEYARPRLRNVLKPTLELLAGIPTVVYGFFALTFVTPVLQDIWFGSDPPEIFNALSAGLVMGIMIIPFISSMADDSIAAVPQAMRDGSLAMGATTSETIRKVLLPAALPGVMGGILLAVSRAIGETMIVVMAAGLAANLTANPFDSVTTVTAQIVQLLTGDQEFDSAKTLAAFALGLALFLITLVLNLIALGVVRRYREAYE